MDKVQDKIHIITVTEKKIIKDISKLSTTNCIIALPVILDQIPKTISRITRIIIAANPAFSPNE